MAYPVPEKRRWLVQVEFLDGTIIDGMSDEDVLVRWRRLAGWADPLADTQPNAWLSRVIDRCEVFYGADLGADANDSPTEILNAMFRENCIILRRR